MQSTHSQKLEQGRTRGEYRIFLPDNRWQIVSYVADDDGYRATVRYENGPHDIPRSEQSHWGFSTGSLNSPLSSEPDRNDPPTYPPRNSFPPTHNSGQPPFSIQNFPPQFQPYQGVLTSQVNTFIVHPTPTEKGREIEDIRKRVEQHRPLPNVPGGIEPKPFHHNPSIDITSAPSSSPPPVYIPQPNPFQQPPRPTTPTPIYSASRPDKYPDPPVYIPKGKPPKVEEQDSIIYDPNVFHPFYQPTEKPRILAAQPIRPFHLPDQFYENRPHQQQPVVSNLERPVRPNPIPQQQNEPRPQLNQQESPPKRYPPTAPPAKVENRPPQQQNPRPYLDKPSSNQWTPLYQPAPTRPTYPPKPYEPQPYPSTPSYPNKPTEPAQRPFKASLPFNPVDPYVAQQRPQYQPEQPYQPRPRPPYPLPPPFYPERPVQTYEPQPKPTYSDKPVEVYVPQQRPAYPDKPVASYEPQQKPVQPYETEPPKYETTPSYHEKPTEPNETKLKPITFFSNNPPEFYEQQKPSYKPIPSDADKPTRPYEPDQKPKYETTPPEKPVEPHKPVTFFSNEPEESYEPEQKPEKPIEQEEKLAYNPVTFFSDKPAVSYEPEEKPEPAPTYPAQRPQYNEEYRPQYQRPFVNQQPNDFRPLYPLYPARPDQPIRPVLKPGYVIPESNYRPEKRPYGVPHSGYSPGTPLSGITSIRPILNPRNQTLVTITLDESLEGDAPTEPPEFQQEEITSTTKKPEPLRKYKVNQPIFRKPTYQNSPPRSKIVRPSTNNRIPSPASSPIEPVTEKSIDQEDSPLLAKFKFKGSTTSNNDGYGQRTQPRRKQPSQKQTISDLTVTSLLEEDGPSESIRGYSRIRDENDEPFSVTVIPDDDQLSDLESFLPVEEEFYSNNSSDSDVFLFDDGIIPPLLLRVRDKPLKIVEEEVTVSYVVTTDYQTEIPTTTVTSTEFPSITAPPTEVPSTTISPTTAITTTTTTTTTQATSTKAGGTKKKKKRVRVKSLKRGNGTRTIMPASKKVSILVKEEEKGPVIKIASNSSSTVAAPRTHSPRIRFPPKVRFVQKTSERVTRQNDKDVRDEDLIASDSVNLAVTSLRENDEIGDHAATIEDMMEWSLNSIPIDRLDLVYDSAELEEKPVE